MKYKLLQNGRCADAKRGEKVSIKSSADSLSYVEFLDLNKSQYLKGSEKSCIKSSMQENYLSFPARINSDSIPSKDVFKRR